MIKKDNSGGRGTGIVIAVLVAVIVASLAWMHIERRQRATNQAAVPQDSLLAR